MLKKLHLHLHFIVLRLKQVPFKSYLYHTLKQANLSTSIFLVNFRSCLYHSTYISATIPSLAAFTLICRSPRYFTLSITDRQIKATQKTSL